MGQCPECGSWGSLSEQRSLPKTAALGHVSAEPLSIQSLPSTGGQRIISGIAEFDRVMGGGLMEGSIILLGGEPGIGKSTILLQLADAMALQHRVLYVSAEESAPQLKLRSDRLNLRNSFQILVETRFEAIEQTANDMRPKLIIIDSVQTVAVMESDSPAGSLAQIREITTRMLQLCKPNNITAVLVGHITKDGSIAGPKSLEHMVDGVFYFEGDKMQDLRLIRAQKNRFGPTGELGIWRMTDMGLIEVKNPSAVLLAHRPLNAPGSAVVPCMEGTRPLLIELQVLASHSAYGTPRRLTTGLDSNRAAMLFAVLEKHLGLHCAGLDLFASVVGGISVREPALDLGLALALVSAIRGTPLPSDLVAFGEVGLVGELRAVRQTELRIKECRQLGFKRMICPQRDDLQGEDLRMARNVAEAVELAFDH